ncbi:outer membrane beta-barrel family protein [Robertkochia solimangrovi]|uniref:outer membrane beta-barrel family protein n=1 Tax=Robertkochia solimangrovi TaxID=2213046 RepID=UPI00117CC191|nr:outer membrane beta-barrel family protein [Robertkochia solimangrovi]TRZ43563.1 TonB-dependent receptor [Robertkochia solimangrovi]
MLLHFVPDIRIISILLIFVGMVIGWSQNSAITITGKVIDSISGDPIPFATITIKSTLNSQVITGGVTAESGEFSVSTEASEIFIEISFMGYRTRTMNNLHISQGTNDFGVIQLHPQLESLEAVVVEGEVSTVEFKLDRRVFNVGKDISSTGMGALDVLNNVPSVTVDIEGQVSLRGNRGVQILINGKPSVLADDSGNALGTITADMIESIEVITNPSAKYEAGGTSGIINIILKKEEKRGFNGSISVNGGIPDNHSLGVSLNNRSEKFNLFSQIGVGYRSLPTERESLNRNLESQTAVITDGKEFRNETFVNITLGADYYLNPRNIITLSGNFAFEKEDSPSDYKIDSQDEDSKLTSSYRRIGETSADNPKYQFDLQYKKQIGDNEDHVLLGSATGNFFGKKQESTFTNLLLAGELTDTDQRTETDFYQSDYTFKLDYTNPINDNYTLESGGMYEINDVGNDYIVYNREDGSWIIDEDLTNDFRYNQKVLGLYATGSYEGEHWGIKLGMRVEITNLNTLLVNTRETNDQNYTNLFPTVHSSYKLSDDLSIQLGFSRRIFRPRLWDLNPFFSIQNTYNIRRGNPFLQPEFSDSYELTGIADLDKLSLNASLYYLHTTDVVESVSRFEGNVNITTPQNIGTRDQYGLELNGKYVAANWLTITGDLNYGYFFRNGSFEDQDFDFNGNRWSVNSTLKFGLPAAIDLEITGNYQSKYKTVQGEISGFAFLDAGLRKKLWQGKAIINLGVRDLFASRIEENNIRQADFYQYNQSLRGRFLTLGFSYSFGKGEAMTYSGGRR